MKTTNQKIQKQVLRRGQEERKTQARLADLKKLRRAVWLNEHRIIAFFTACVSRIIAFFAAWFGTRPFDWEERYNNIYLLKWAKENGWKPARLFHAVEMVDRSMRFQRNRIQRALDAMKRRGRAVARWNKRIRAKKAAEKNAKGE